MALMERPAPVRLVTDDEGANMEPTQQRLTTEQRLDIEATVRARPNRAFVEALIIHYDVSYPEIDAYADRLAGELWQTDRATRQALYTAMVAFLDGFNAGFDKGFDYGHADGRWEAERGIPAD